MLALVAFGEPILTMPIGSPEDVPFADQDLFDMGLEFPSEPGAYFGNEEQTIICIPSLLTPALQWCAPKAEPWIEPVYVPVHIPTIYIPQAPPIVLPAPPILATPEPALTTVIMFGFMVAMLTFRRRKTS